MRGAWGKCNFTHSLLFFPKNELGYQPRWKKIAKQDQNSSRTTAVEHSTGHIYIIQYSEAEVISIGESENLTERNLNQRTLGSSPVGGSSPPYTYIIAHTLTIWFGIFFHYNQGCWSLSLNNIHIIMSSTSEFNLGYECMVSFDVTSLYTNVPIKDTLYIIRELLLNDDEYENKTRIPIDKLMSSVQVVLTKTWYLFDDHAPRVWKRFVDDVFLIIKRAHLDAFHEHINNLHPKIQFTTEHEKNGTLPFLDTLVSRNGGNLSVSVYRKPTHTDQYLNHTSNHQLSCKESAVSSLLDRAVNVVSGENDRKKELSHINNALLANGYLRQTIKRVERKIRNRTDKNSDGEDAENEPVATVCMPYIPETSNILRRRVNVIVYEIPCKDCDAVYVGETKRMFKQRVQEHKRAVRNADTDKNEIADYSWKNDHVIDWDNKKIIDRESGWKARKVKETINSIDRNTHINREAEVLLLERTYYNLQMLLGQFVRIGNSCQRRGILCFSKKYGSFVYF
ncbi:uncharacterized protein LOC130625075 [Hydractinia symbiolongicarpus]|uniref:uncharacterized protein LOC130625075 n=1 Tax=Hydractinia symbiolongicarpus TaxID=13093 RepID=UPI00254E2DFC|nr:uncharacterized protein LOC130625075 [Hydractinia symbiolongicarpus]